MIKTHWKNLSWGKQQALISDRKVELLAQAEKEGQELLKHNFPRYKTWQEAFCDEYAIDWEMSKDKSYDWVFALDQYLEEQAEEELRLRLA